ncbi:TPA: hypothetical protein ACU9Z1_005924 [Pseudomonas aeruginosa]
MKKFALLAICLLALDWPTAQAQEICMSCLKVRVGRPLVVRDGTGEPGLDTKFYVVKTPAGGYRGYSSGGGSAYAISGPAAWSMGWPAQPVLGPGARGSASECGVWINSPIPISGVYVAAIHQEQKCNYANGSQTHKSMGISYSHDGLSWTNPVTVISSPLGPKTGQQTGEGDCSLVHVPGNPHLYMYCLRTSNWDTIVARAPAGSYMNPASWKKLSGGLWASPGIAGNADSVGKYGYSAGYLRPYKRVFLLDADPWFGGVKMSMSSDYVNFSEVSEPLIPFTENNWDRVTVGRDSDLIAYLGVANYAEGGNAVDSTGWGLTYVYVPHGGTLGDKFLVFQDVRIELTNTKQPTSVGLALTRWSNRLNGKFRTTTFPITNQADFTEGPRVAYVLTKRPASVESIELEECKNTYDVGEYLLTGAGDCTGTWHKRLGTVGWLYKIPQANTVPVYRCYSPTRQAHFASNRPDCDGLGNNEYLLGYGLRD